MRAACSLPRAALRLLQLALLSIGAGEAKAFGAAVRWGRADLNSVMKALAAFERKIGDSVAAAEALAAEFGFPLPA